MGPIGNWEKKDMKELGIVGNGVAAVLLLKDMEENMVLSCLYSHRYMCGRMIDNNSNQYVDR